MWHYPLSFIYRTVHVRPGCGSILKPQWLDQWLDGSRWRGSMLTEDVFSLDARLDAGLDAKLDVGSVRGSMQLAGSMPNAGGGAQLQASGLVAGRLTPIPLVEHLNVLPFCCCSCSTLTTEQQKNR